jgi:2-dehydropantoate 2-reductase
MGAGATGGYLGGVLARGGEDVTFVARGAQLEAMRHRGLTIKSPPHDDMQLEVTATGDVRSIRPDVDLIMFCVKTYDADAAIEAIKPIVGPATVVLPIQNGIDTVDRLRQGLGEEHILGGLAYMSAAISEPGVIDLKSSPVRLVLGELGGGSTPRVEAVQNCLSRSGIQVEVHANVRQALWEKFVFICGVNGVTAVTRLPMGSILAAPETSAFLRSLMSEAVSVGQESGIALSADSVERALSTAGKMGSNLRGSMYYDLASGKRLELEALNGAVVRLGRARNVPTPSNFAVYACLKPFVNGLPGA